MWIFLFASALVLTFAQASIPSTGTPPPDVMSCRTVADRQRFQALFAFDPAAMVYYSNLVINATGNWYPSPAQEFYDCGWYSVNRTLKGHCLVNATYASVVPLSNPDCAGVTIGYLAFAFCQKFNLKEALDCTSVPDCNVTNCATACVEQNSTLSCFCNATGNLTDIPPCVHPTPILTASPTQSPIIAPDQFVTSETIFLIVAGGVDLVLCVAAYVYVRRTNLKADATVIFTLGLSLFDLLADAVLCFSLWSGHVDTGPWEPLVLLISIVLGLFAGMGLYSYIYFMSESKQGVSTWISASPSRAAACFVLSIIESSNIKFFSSQVTPHCHCPWSAETHRIVDVHGAWLGFVESIPQLVVQISLARRSQPSLVVFVSLAVSLVTLVFGLGRRVTLLMLWRKARYTERKLAVFKTSTDTREAMIVGEPGEQSVFRAADILDASLSSF